MLEIDFRAERCRRCQFQQSLGLVFYEIMYVHWFFAQQNVRQRAILDIRRLYWVRFDPVAINIMQLLMGGASVFNDPAHA